MDRPNRSRHGLTRCRACRAHIHTSDRPSQTTCPFCGENQLGIPKHRARSKIMAAGRGGLLAAGLMAFSAIGCAEGEQATPAPEPSAQTSPEAQAQEPMQPMQPGEVVVAPTPEPVAPEPEPVEPEPVEPEEPEPVVQRPRPRPRPDPVRPTPPPDEVIAVPAYGVAPPDEWEPRPTPDMRPMARYGLPPMRNPTAPEPSDG